MARAADVERPGAEHWVPADADVDALRSAVHDCRGCELWQPATQAVFSDGPSTARLLLVGEQPGDQEDRQGEPFVGPAGRVLDEALEAAGIAHDDVYVTNAVKHFRFEERGKRRLHKKPGAVHVEACRPWLLAELGVVRPRVVVCLGGTAARGVLGHDVKVTEVRGTLLTGDEAGPAADAVVVTTHPSAVLRLRGKDGYREAFDALVADLRTAAAAA
ncbi:UdgX family uracil-DNA binding protein [Actinotalea ferrariae]|uniref:UdgX family uracil-DNA binding protein n=1 Tax=Actinotalea ferrariae TaxID=1386098 RepID=UPI001C8C3B41|nr:UdgX family uracil-DNA binding protein [Actinotalea ferrariae]MBX9245951.1 UdgX family uracil-DNA binding protein [Actinotalea ferrariae]